MDAPLVTPPSGTSDLESLELRKRNVGDVHVQKGGAVRAEKDLQVVHQSLHGVDGGFVMFFVTPAVYHK